MKKYAILCGSAPNDYRQKKLEKKYDFLETKEGFEPGSIVSFPNGVTELFLESTLNEAFDKATDDDSDSGKVFLYLFAKTEADLNAELSDSCVEGVKVVRLGNNEIRKEVLAYYADLAEKQEIDFLVVYDFDSEFISEEELGFEKV
ncbi:MAG: hypothetical protein IJR39_13005 [Treponema sp.]|nr:hypothetical protein [Treponema sp.]MBQ9624236.1 hypothetical protein [Treponema sp.]